MSFDVTWRESASQLPKEDRWVSKLQAIRRTRGLYMVVPCCTYRVGRPWNTSTHVSDVPLFDLFRHLGHPRVRGEDVRKSTTDDLDQHGLTCKQHQNIPKLRQHQR